MIFLMWQLVPSQVGYHKLRPDERQSSGRVSSDVLSPYLACKPYSSFRIFMSLFSFSLARRMISSMSASFSQRSASLNASLTSSSLLYGLAFVYLITLIRPIHRRTILLT